MCVFYYWQHSQASFQEAIKGEKQIFTTAENYIKFIARCQCLLDIWSRVILSIREKHVGRSHLTSFKLYANCKLKREGNDDQVASVKLNKKSSDALQGFKFYQKTWESKTIFNRLIKWAVSFLFFIFHAKLASLAPRQISLDP